MGTNRTVWTAVNAETVANVCASETHWVPSHCPPCVTQAFVAVMVEVTLESKAAWAASELAIRVSRALMIPAVARRVALLPTRVALWAET